jgi:hypothetical protein
MENYSSCAQNTYCHMQQIRGMPHKTEYRTLLQGFPSEVGSKWMSHTAICIVRNLLRVT